MSRILRVFSGADLRSGHMGLSKVARKAGHAPEELSTGEYIVFINSKRNAFKLLAAHDVLAHYRHPSGHVIDARALQYIPQVFESKGHLSYDKALKIMFETKAL